MVNENSKRRRQQLLKKIISEQEIGDQLHLLEELKKKGIAATQATVSRDLQEIGVVKVRVKAGAFKYSMVVDLPKNYLIDQLRVLFEHFVYSIGSTGNLMIVKTSPGNANGVASLIDRISFAGCLGTIAGDDTILVIVDSAKNRIKLEKHFNDLLAAVNQE